MGENAARQITQQFISKKANPEAKIEMHRCRIRAEFFSADNSELQQQNKSPLAAPALSGDVCNSRHNDVGALELHEMSDPRASCTRGGFKVLLSSEFKAPTLKKGQSGGGYPIHAVFVVVRNGETMHAERAYPDFNQISLAKDSFQIHHNTLAFLVPAQSAQVIRAMKAAGDAASVALFRPHDGKYSQSRFEFRYVEHPDMGVCHFCEVLRPTELRKYVRARKDHRRRVTEAGGGGGGSGSGGGGGGPSAGASPSSSSGGGGNSNSGGSSSNFRYNMSHDPYSPAYDSSTSGVYSPESSSNSQYGVVDDPYLGSPDPKRPCVPTATTATVVATDMESCSSSCSNGETTTVASVQLSQPLLPEIHVQPPQQLLDNWVQQVTSEAFMHSPNSELPIPEVMDASELSLGDKSSASAACPAYIPSPTHSPIMGQSATTNLLQSQVLPEDLAGVDLLADLLRPDYAGVTTDSPSQSDFNYLVPPSKEEVSRMRRRRGENFSGSSDEGIDILDGETRLPAPPQTAKEPDLTSDLVDQRQDEQDLSDKFSSLELDTKTESAPAASVENKEEAAETRQEDSGVWLKVLCVALIGVFVYEMMRLFTPVHQ